MDYFNDVYLKKINRFGDNIQDRVHGQMRNDFENKLKKSVNTVKLYNLKNKEIGIGILETKKVDEKQLNSYLCTRVEDKYNSGFVFKTIDSDKNAKTWLVVLQEKYQTIGYNRYKVVLLDNLLEWIGTDGLIHSSYVHYIGSLDGALKENFSIDFDTAVGNPTKNLKLICSYNDDLKRDLRINISDETWRVVGYDKISIPGVMYVTLEEDFIQKTKYANQEELTKWNIISEQGYDISIPNKSYVQFYVSYDGVLNNEKILFDSNDNIKIKCDKNNINRFMFEGDIGTVQLTAYIAAAPLVKQNFTINITEDKTDWIAIIGPNQIKLMQTVEYELNSSFINKDFEILSINGNFKVNRIDGNKVYIQGINIGQDNIVIVSNETTYTTPINIISPWM